MTLHAYWCHLPPRTVGMSYDPPDPGETYAPCGIYLAATRGRAKKLFLLDHERAVYPGEFVDVRTNCVERNVDAVLDRYPAQEGPLGDPRNEPPGETAAERLYYRCWSRVHELEQRKGGGGEPR